MWTFALSAVRQVTVWQHRGVARQKLNPVDAIWLNTDYAANRTVIEALFLLDGALDLPRFERVLQERVVDRFAVFRQRVVASRFRWTRPAWEEVPGFRAAQQVRSATLAPTGTSEGDDKLLQAYVATFLAVPLPRDRPLWEVHVIDGLTAGAAIYVRLHHTLADGIALTRVLLSLTDLDALGAQDASQLVVGKSPATLSWPVAVRRVLQVPWTGLTLLFARNPTTATTAKAGPAKLVVWSKPIPLQPVKDLARATDTKVNDVLVAALAGALRRYQMGRGDHPVDVGTAIPVNLRPLHKPLPAELGNKFALVLLSLPSGVALPRDRLVECGRRMTAIKNSPEVLIVYAVMNIIGRTGPWFSRLLVNFFAAKADAVTTNVPGPREHRYLAGTRIRGILGWVPAASDQTLGTCIFTYADQVWVGVKSDALAIPDPERILAEFHLEMDVLIALQG